MKPKDNSDLTMLVYSDYLEEIGELTQAQEIRESLDNYAYYYHTILNPLIGMSRDLQVGTTIYFGGVADGGWRRTREEVGTGNTDFDDDITQRRNNSPGCDF
jgi:hypothetical protein